MKYAELLKINDLTVQEIKQNWNPLKVKHNNMHSHAILELNQQKTVNYNL